MDIYIKPAEKVQLVGKREVLLRQARQSGLWSFGFRRSEKRRISFLWWI